jgi:hypothetical protein
LYFIPVFSENEESLSTQAKWIHWTGWGDICFAVGSIFCLLGSFTGIITDSKNWSWLPFVAAGFCFTLEWTCHFIAAIRY